MPAESTERISFSASDETSDPQDHVEADGQACRKSHESRMRILVIDDSESILAVLQEALAYWGHEVFVASGGGEGLKIYERNTIDAVVCDLTMPDISGLQVAEQIRTICSERGIRKTPFVLLTGWNDETCSIEGMYGRGVDRVLEKPANLMELIRVLSELDKASRDNCNARSENSGP